MSNQDVPAQENSTWREFYGFVYGNLRIRGIAHHDAEDLAQDILEAACLHLEDVEPGRRRAWFLTVMRNKVVDRARRSRHLHSVAELPEPPDPGLGPDELVIVEADREVLYAAIARLRKRDRRLVELRYLEERSIDETARELGMSVGAVKVGLHRVRGRLRSTLESGARTIADRRGGPMVGVAERAVLALTPYVGQVAADTCVRGTAITLGKTFDTLTLDDYDALSNRIRRILAPLLPPPIIERLLDDIRGGALL